MEQLNNDYEAGVLKTLSTRVFIENLYGTQARLLAAGALLLLSSFGLWLIAALYGGVRAWRSSPRAVLWFPVLVVGNYLVMAMGLSLNTTGVGSWYELLNRPLVWAYFALVVWSAALLYHTLLGNRAPQSGVGKATLLSTVVALLLVPIFLGPQLQTFPSRPGLARFEQFSAFPVCVLHVAEYLRQNSRQDEVFQDSANDPRYVLMALAKRHIFTNASVFIQRPAVLESRLQELRQFAKLEDLEEIRRFAAARGITWYVLQPETFVAWPRAFLDQAEFECGGTRVYRLLSP